MLVIDVLGAGTPSVGVMKEVHELSIARAHRPRFPETEGHRKFMESYAAKARALATDHPYLDLEEEIAYFSRRNA